MRVVKTLIIDKAIACKWFCIGWCIKSAKIPTLVDVVHHLCLLSQRSFKIGTIERVDFFVHGAAIRTIAIIGSPCTHARYAPCAAVLTDAVVGSKHQFVVAVGRALLSHADEIGRRRRPGWIGR